MVEYIKREDAINLLWLYADELCASVVSDFESLSAVPVVRCRECTHYKICDEWKNGKRMLCEVHHHAYLDHDGDNHFCSWGQLKIETALPKSDAKDESLEADHEIS